MLTSVTPPSTPPSANPGELHCHTARTRGFYGTVISFQVVFSQSSDSESFLVVHTLFKQDGCQREGFWEVSDMRCLLLTFPELFWLVVAY